MVSDCSSNNECVNEYDATLKSSPEQDMYISRLVGASVFFTSNGQL